MDQNEAWNAVYAREHPVWKGPSDVAFDAVKGSKVLEIGCGDGKTERSLAIGELDIVSIDSSRNAVVKCATPHRNERIQWMISDVTDLPFRDGVFDVAVASHVLEHVVDRRRAVQEIKRVLNDHGRIVLRVFSVKDMRFGRGTPVGTNSFERGGLLYHYFSMDEIKDLFSEMSVMGLEEKCVQKRYGIRSVIVGEFRKG